MFSRFLGNAYLFHPHACPILICSCPVLWKTSSFGTQVYDPVVKVSWYLLSRCPTVSDSTKQLKILGPSRWRNIARKSSPTIGMTSKLRILKVSWLSLICDGHKVPGWYSDFLIISHKISWKCIWIQTSYYEAKYLICREGKSL